jgi:alpha-L-fucosidase 2
VRDVRADAIGQAAAAAAKPIGRLRQRAVDDHRALFRRVSLRLSPAPIPDRPTDERLAAVQAGGEDPRLVELYFQYGRYLLMGSSRPGGMPANLQGLWNKEMQAPWSADNHININIQMNYWPAGVTNLAETEEPFFDFIDAMARVSGRPIAQQFYGTRGFVGHYTTDAWLFTPASGGVQYALWQMGGAWTTRHFLEHYWFTGDRQFLRARAYPMLKDASLFLLDWLVPHPRTGKLVAGPSASPENQFIGPDGGTYSASMGDAMDQEMAWDVFSNFLAASNELGLDDDLVRQVRDARDRLAWPGIGSDGRLMEWAEEFKEKEPGHRHMSHLYGVHPGAQFTQAKTPEYMAAARKSIEVRLAQGGGHTGWSRAWIINFWARFRDAEQAYANVQALLARSTLTNLFDNHPPFQIDGNFGGTAGIAEMLIQSHDGDVTLLPALPKAWATGQFTGLRARGGFEVAVTWKDGAVVTATVRSLLGNPLRLRFGSTLRELPTSRGRAYTFRGASLR